MVWSCLTGGQCRTGVQGCQPHSDSFCAVELPPEPGAGSPQAIHSFVLSFFNSLAQLLPHAAPGLAHRRGSIRA